MATPEEMLAKLEERFILGQITEETYRELAVKLRSNRRGFADVEATQSGTTVQDSVVKGDVSTTSGASSIGNINLHFGAQSSRGTGELEYERTVLMLLKCGGAIDQARADLEYKRQDLGLSLRLAKEIEQSCRDAHGVSNAAGRRHSGDLDLKSQSSGLMHIATQSFDRKEYQTAFALFMKLAEAGSAEAMHYLAAMYVNGQGVQRSGAHAVHWAKQAFEGGDVISGSLVADLYTGGWPDLPDNPAESVKWRRKTAERGVVHCMKSLAWSLENGWGVERDDAEALAWWRRAADAGDAEAKKRLGR